MDAAAYASVVGGKIAPCVKRLAGLIRSDYRGKNSVVGGLNGSFIFLAELVREINMPLTVDFIRAQSYRSTASSGKVKVSPGKPIPVEGRHVLLVEDIVHTGILSVLWLFPTARARNPSH